MPPSEELENDLQVVEEPTREPSTSLSLIDLVFLLNCLSLVSCSVLAPLVSSDHSSILVSISVSPQKHDKNPLKKQVWLYKKADISLARSLLSQLPLAKDSDSIDVFWTRWSKMFMTAIHCFVPHKFVSIKSSNPWINNDIKKTLPERIACGEN